MLAIVQVGKAEVLPGAHLHGRDVIDSYIVLTKLHILHGHPHHQRTDVSRPQPNPLHSRSPIYHTEIIFKKLITMQFVSIN